MKKKEWVFCFPNGIIVWEIILPPLMYPDADVWELIFYSSPQIDRKYSFDIKSIYFSVIGNFSNI